MRLSKIYTRQGDDGSTGLAGGERVAKSTTIISALGEADHCNSLLGWAMIALPEPIQQQATAIQHLLFDLGGELAMDGYIAIKEADVVQLESWLDELNAELKPLKEFILPGGGEPAARLQVFRTAVRGLERCLVELSKQRELNPQSLKWVNRLSDWAFVAARFCNVQAGIAEPYWQPSQQR